MNHNHPRHLRSIIDQVNQVNQVDQVVRVLSVASANSEIGRPSSVYPSNHNHLRHQRSIGSLFGSNSSAALVTRHSPKATRCRFHSLVTDHLSHKKKNPLQAAGNFWSASPEASHTSTSEAYTQKNIRFRFCIQCANSPECLRLYFPTL